MRDLILGQSKLGKGIFANKNFKVGDEIIEFKGKTLKREDLPKIKRPEDDRYVQIGRNLYLGPSGHLDDFFNHSCNPNSGLKIEDRKVLLTAISDIKKEEEITWDYSTTMDEDNWQVSCSCGSRLCRGRIRDFKYLPQEIQLKYIKLNIVPEYVFENSKLNLKEDK